MKLYRVAISRIAQKAMYIGVKFVPYKKQEKIQTAEGVSVKLKEKGIKRPFFISGVTTSKHKETNKILEFLK